MFFHYLENCQQSHQANIIEPLGQPSIIKYIFNEFCPHQHDSKIWGQNDVSWFHNVTWSHIF
jgi:hypothetical protein